LKPIAIIPARGGSKRIPGKNIRPLNGKPALTYAVENALASKLFSEVYVSTDSLQIQSIANACGANYSPLRPSFLSNDSASTLEVISFEANRLKDLNDAFENICCIYPLTPLLKEENLIESFKIFSEGHWNYLCAILKEDSQKQRHFKLGNDSKISNLSLPQMQVRTQDLDEYFVDAGQFYWGTSKAWIEGIPIFGDRTCGYLMSKLDAVDVDNLEDLHLLEILMQNRNSKSNPLKYVNGKVIL
jgi:pseudaminic acid cytidylyltransferase